jgi:biotin transport system substrate-specific component
MFFMEIFMPLQATLPLLISGNKYKSLANMGAIFAGVMLLSLLAQVSIPLPWTPVPVTGQTMGVALIALSWGWKRSGVVVLSYLLLGSLGAPVFAAGGSGFLFGATFGYLMGMLVAAIVMGYLADRGFTNSFLKTLLVAYLGSAITFSFGVLGLSFFLPTEALFVAGVQPFLPGDTIKNCLAAYITFQARKKCICPN